MDKRAKGTVLLSHCSPQIKKQPTPGHVDKAREKEEMDKTKSSFLLQ